MEIAFGQKLWGVILVVSLLVAVAITLLMYYRAKGSSELSRGRLRLLMVLRFLSVFFLAFMLAAPLVKTLRKITRQPLILLAYDNSRSMTGVEGSAITGEELRRLVSGLQEKLGDRFDLVTYAFGQTVSTGPSTAFTDKRSDYSQLLQTVYDNHFNDNTGALVIVGDGNYNQGENPLHHAGKLSFPVYTLATGDTTPVRDAAVADLKVNRTAFAGNLFPVEADLRVTGTRQERLLFSVLREGKRLFSQTVEPAGASWYATLAFTLPAEGKGLQYYTAMVESLPGEQNLTNNRWPFVINILENKQKILILAEGAHPDAGALKNSLQQQANYEVTLVTGEPYPADLSDYNLIILHQLPSSSHAMQQLTGESSTSRIPLLVIVGPQTHLAQLNAMELGVKITPRAGAFEEAQMSVADNFTPFTLSEELRENLAKYPPLKVPFATYDMEGTFQPLGFQRIKNIVTPWPLLATGSIRGRKTGFLLGEGLWRWRLYNYTLTGNHDQFNELFDKLVQYLALRDNEDNFMVGFKPVYTETEPVRMTAEVYNDAYEMINTPEVTIAMTDSTGREFNYIFDRSDLFYRLDAGIFPPGRYAFKASVTSGPDTYTEKGEFAVIPVNVELADLRANHRLLYQLSFETGGKFFRQEEADQLAEAIGENTTIQPVSYFQAALNELLNLRFLFFPLLLLLSAEWFLRKYWGNY